MAVAARSAAICSTFMSWLVNRRGLRVPACITPMTFPPDRSGAPMSDRMPLSSSSGLTTLVWSTSSRITQRSSAAIRPAKPLPTGTLTPCCTSSSSPLAAVATRCPDGMSSSSTAVVSAPSACRTRSTSVTSNSCGPSRDSAASATDSMSRSLASMSASKPSAGPRGRDPATNPGRPYASPLSHEVPHASRGTPLA